MLSVVYSTHFIGHLLAGTIKDIVTRFAHQNGFHVERRFGWDTHGLPVEYEVKEGITVTYFLVRNSHS